MYTWALYAEFSHKKALCSLSIGLSHSGLDVMAYVEAAEGELTDIFEKAKRAMWVARYPKKLTMMEAASTPPSQAGKAFEAKVFSGLPQKELALFTGHIERLKVEVVKLLSPPNRHNNTYWSGFINSLLFDLADGFTTERERNEAEVRAQLLEPLLKKIAHSVECMSIGGGTGLHYSSGLSMEVKTEQRARLGHRPQVDYVLSAHAQGRLIYCVPVAVKDRLELSDVPQLTSYQGAMADDKRIGVGLLMDRERMRLACLWSRQRMACLSLSRYP